MNRVCSKDKMIHIWIYDSFASPGVYLRNVSASVQILNSQSTKSHLQLLSSGIIAHFPSFYIFAIN